MVASLTDSLLLGLVWRIVIGLSLIPAFGTLYQRLTLPESTRYKESQKPDLIEQSDLKKEKGVDEAGVHTTESEDDEPSVPAPKKAHFQGMVPCCVECGPWCHECFRGH